MLKVKHVVALLIGAAISTEALAQAENRLICIKRNGQVRMSNNDACKRRETAAVIATAPRGSSPTPTITQQGQSVRDANGQELGTLMYGGEERVSVYNKAANLLVRLHPAGSDQTILWPDTWNTQAYVYTSTDCSGEPVRVFHVDGDGSVAPNGLSFWGEREIFSIVWAEANTNPDTRQEELTGRYLALGSLVHKDVNTNTYVDNDEYERLTTGPVIQSMKLTNDGSSGCTHLTVSTQPKPPEGKWQNGQWVYIYDGRIYTDYNAASRDYYRDYFLYRHYEQNNMVSNGSTRWVYQYATTQAPFASPVKLPLQFPATAPVQ